MPTIPSPRDGAGSGRSYSSKSFTRSPGRTYSMSRLDQLAQPRKRPTELSTLMEQQAQPLGASSMSRSMSHLAASSSSSAAGKSLKRSDNSRSMGTLPGAVLTPRPTRAERLRRKARDHHSLQQQQGKTSLCAQLNAILPRFPSPWTWLIYFRSLQPFLDIIHSNDVRSCVIRIHNEEHNLFTVKV